MNDDFHFGANKNKVPTKAITPAQFCWRRWYYAHLRRIAKQNEQEKIEKQIIDEMDYIIEQQELEKRNHSFRTWLFNNKINSNDHNIKDLKARADTSIFRYMKNDGLYIDSDLIPQMVGEGWITEEQSKENASIDILLEFYDHNPINPNFDTYYD